MTQNAYSRIWKTVALIPAGKVAAYGQVADLAGLPGRARMIGKALGFAPKELQLPWHRVLRSSGQIAFPVGSDLATEQQQRLRQEGVMVNGLRVSMKKYQWQPDLPTLLMALDY